MQDIGLMIAAIYLSSFVFVIMPLLGVISGAVAGWIMRGGSIGLGALIGLGAGLLLLLTFVLLGWAASGLLFKASQLYQWSRNRGGAERKCGAGPVGKLYNN